MEALENNTIELNERRALIYLPEDAIEATLLIKIYQDGSIIEAQKKLGVRDLHEAFRNGEEWFIGDEDRFAITEKGEELVSKLLGELEE